MTSDLNRFQVHMLLVCPDISPIISVFIHLVTVDNMMASDPSSLM